MDNNIITNGNFLNKRISDLAVILTNLVKNYASSPIIQSTIATSVSNAVTTSVSNAVTNLFSGQLLRTKLTANTTFYVAPSTGSPAGNDTTGNGTIGSPWQTLQHAYNTLYNNYDAVGYTITIQMANGTYAPVKCIGTLPGVSSTNPIIINGNSSNPNLTIIDLTTPNSNCIYIAAGAYISVSNFKVQSSNLSSGANGIYLDYLSFCLMSVGMVYGSFNTTTNNSYQIVAASGGRLYFNGSYSVVGNATGHILLTSTAEVFMAGPTAVTVSGGLTISTWVICTACATGFFDPVKYTISLLGSQPTGSKYYIVTNGVISTLNSSTGASAGPNFFPGTTAGSYAQGGLYV